MSYVSCCLSEVDNFISGLFAYFISFEKLVNFIIMSKKLCNPSAMRNREAILQVLLKHIEPTFNGLFLEIASGTGNHVDLYAPKFPNIKFQPTDIDERSIESIQEIAKECSTKNICPPMFVDIRKPFTEWGKPVDTEGPFLVGTSHKDFSELENCFDFMLNVNMIHISEFACTEGLFANAGKLLKPKGKLFTYGPYAENGVLTPESNVNFDLSLKSRNKDWGVRDIVHLEEVARKNGINLVEKVEMPSNNKCLVWQKA
ncbi:methyltransferase-like 26 [Culicoides brevitarsis]|uniref:methyltransferase-like 26 n=1 Tax=Culicoides brevitarsis TaxID=469753 RepID=UPI00307C166A